MVARVTINGGKSKYVIKNAFNIPHNSPTPSPVNRARNKEPVFAKTDADNAPENPSIAPNLPNYIGYITKCKKARCYK